MIFGSELSVRPFASDPAMCWVWNDGSWSCWREHVLQHSVLWGSAWTFAPIWRAFLYVLYFDNVIFSPENGVRGWRDWKCLISLLYGVHTLEQRRWDHDILTKEHGSLLLHQSTPLPCFWRRKGMTINWWWIGPPSVQVSCRTYARFSSLRRTSKPHNLSYSITGPDRDLYIVFNFKSHLNLALVRIPARKSNTAA